MRHAKVCASTKEFFEIQATIECGFTLKHARDMTRTYRQHNLLAMVERWKKILDKGRLNGAL